MRSYINLFRNYANFRGFLKRKPFWIAIIIHRLIQAAALAPWVYSRFNDSFKLPGYYFCWVLPLLCFYTLLAAIPILAACVRRMHTLPRRGWWLLVGFIPVAGWFIVLIWMLQKGTYEEFERRVQRASGSNLIEPLHRLLKDAEKPRAGGWFFVVFLLLAAGGWYLNRQIMQNGSLPAVRNALPANVSAFLLKGIDEAPEPASEIEHEPVEAETLPEPTATAEPEPTPIPVIYLQPSEDNPLTNQRSGAVILPVGKGFFASQYAVSVGEYRECVLAGVCGMPAELNTMAYRGLVPEDQIPDANTASLPMVYVTRDDAAAYCEWTGMRLPTAAEWQAAFALSEIVFTADNANCVGTDRTPFINNADQIAQTIPVTAFSGSVPESAPVQMAGNVWEWTAPAEDGKTALALGGAWNSYPDMLTADASLETLPGYAADNIGFRCFVSAPNVTADFFEGGEPAPEPEIEEIEAEEIPEEIEAEEISDEEADAAEGTSAPVAKSIGHSGNDAVAISKKSGADAPETQSSGSADGSLLTRPQDGAQMVLIPGGTFSMGAANGAVDEKPAHDVTLSPYWIDIYEVTNAQYALCVAEGVCTEPHETRSFRRSSYYGDPEYDNYPVIYVDWQQASDYCEWTGSRLPTEAQWEYAAKGPDGNRYPWGNTFDSSKLNFSGNGDYDMLPVDGTPDDVSAFGVFNLGGNASEWVADRYQENWYSITNQPEDPTGPENGQYHVIRGSSAQTGENNARTADRFYARTGTYNLDRGFRCARPD